jgi:hypothetical protein
MVGDGEMEERGSAVLLTAWQSGVIKLNDEVVTGLSEVLNGIQGRVETARVGEGRESVAVEIAYDEDTPQCGNDLSLLFRWIHDAGGDIPVRVLINGIPAFDSVRVVLEVGNVG